MMITTKTIRDSFCLRVFPFSTASDFSGSKLFLKRLGLIFRRGWQLLTGGNKLNSLTSLVSPSPLFCCTKCPSPCNHPHSLMGVLASFLFFFLLLPLSSLPLVMCFSGSGVWGGGVRVHVLKPRPWVFSGEGGGRRSKSRSIRRERRGKTAGRSKSEAALSAMLPRGFVPPSGSSWRHNGSPESAGLFCNVKVASSSPPPPSCPKC